MSSPSKLWPHTEPDYPLDIDLPGTAAGAVSDSARQQGLRDVLRAYVYGLLKSCDLAWRELNKGNVYNNEDWQSEKCNVPLGEALPVNYVQAKLEHALQVLPTWKGALDDQLVLHKMLIDLLTARLSKGYHRFRPLVGATHEPIRRTRRTLVPESGPDSSALRAFDPQFARVLVSFIPLHVIQATHWR